MNKLKIISFFLPALLVAVFCWSAVAKAENSNEGREDNSATVTGVKVNASSGSQINERVTEVNVNRVRTQEQEKNYNGEDISNIEANRENNNGQEATNTDDRLGDDGNQERNAALNGERHRSAVATFVQGLLDIADREKGGLGDQVRTIAQEQNAVKDVEAAAIDKVSSRSKFLSFFIGTDYKNIGTLRSQMATTENQLDRLGQLLLEATNTETKTQLQDQIQTLTQEQQRIKNLVTANENKFSVFGWLVKLFY